MSDDLRIRILLVLLRLAGVGMGVAFFAIFLPTEWMAAGHRWLGLGEFPASSLVDYLTRSISALYGFHGMLLLLVSTDVVRFRPIVRFLGVMNVLFGTMMIAIDVHAGLPWHWTVVEGPPVVAFGVVILVLVRSVPSAAHA